MHGFWLSARGDSYFWSPSPSPSNAKLNVSHEFATRERGMITASLQLSSILSSVVCARARGCAGKWFRRCQNRVAYEPPPPSCQWLASPPLKDACQTGIPHCRKCRKCRLGQRHPVPPLSRLRGDACTALVAVHHICWGPTVRDLCTGAG